MSIIENAFKKQANGTYKAVNRQTWLVVFGILGVAFIALMIISDINIYTKDVTFYSITTLFIMSLFLLSPFLFFTAIGLFTQITEINLESRKLKYTRKNFRGQSGTLETDIDKIGISAVRMGITDANPEERWIVRAGFCFDRPDGSESGASIWSKEVTKIDERNNVMFELYRFLFQDRRPPNENDIITNGDAVLLLSDEQKKAFENGTLFDTEPANIQNGSSSKFNNLLT